METDGAALHHKGTPNHKSFRTMPDFRNKAIKGGAGRASTGGTVGRNKRGDPMSHPFLPLRPRKLRSYLPVQCRFSHLSYDSKMIDVVFAGLFQDPALQHPGSQL